ncbi:amidase domain-containing protein, partial [Clostridioides difficile]|uniref:amidase domain-containing protein n=1 Tax=Clostridioides difficile TaxID=1496 RepID=UPI003F8D8B8E
LFIHLFNVLHTSSNTNISIFTIKPFFSNKGTKSIGEINPNSGKKGRITHVSTVTGLDSRGYPLVTCHNTDRMLVPWDLGWSDKS